MHLALAVCSVSSPLRSNWGGGGTFYGFNDNPAISEGSVFKDCLTYVTLYSFFDTARLLMT